MSNSLDPRDGYAYRRRGRAIAAYGLIQCLIGTAGLADRSLLTTWSAVQALDGWIVVVWLIYQSLGGALVAIGVYALRPQLELYGLKALLGFVVINAGAILLNRGPVGGGVTAAALGLSAYVIQGRIGDLIFSAKRDRRVADLETHHDRRASA